MDANEKLYGPMRPGQILSGIVAKPPPEMEPLYQCLSEYVLRGRNGSSSKSVHGRVSRWRKLWPEFRATDVYGFA
jgi:hypothetical protein